MSQQSERSIVVYQTATELQLDVRRSASQSGKNQASVPICTQVLLDSGVMVSSATAWKLAAKQSHDILLFGLEPVWVNEWRVS